jgi:hypothetical protein
MVGAIFFPPDRNGLLNFGLFWQESPVQKQIASKIITVSKLLTYMAVSAKLDRTVGQPTAELATRNRRLYGRTSRFYEEDFNLDSGR